MVSVNPMDRLFALSKVNSLLKESYVGDDFQDPIDVRLVTGLYNRTTDLNAFIKR